jgi:hypothetical protein
MDSDAVAKEELSSKQKQKKRKKKERKKRPKTKADAGDHETILSNTQQKNSKRIKRSNNVVSLEDPAGMHSRSPKRQK